MLRFQNSHVRIVKNVRDHILKAYEQIYYEISDDYSRTILKNLVLNSLDEISFRRGLFDYKVEIHGFLETTCKVSIHLSDNTKFAIIIDKGINNNHAISIEDYYTNKKDKTLFKLFLSHES